MHINFTDLDVDPEVWAAPPEPDRVEWIVTLGIGPWSMVDHFRAHSRKASCPVCEGAPLRRRHYCLGCDRTALDGQVSFPGLGVDEAPDPDWRPEPTVYRPHVGGLGSAKGNDELLRQRVAKRRKPGR